MSINKNCFDVTRKYAGKMKNKNIYKNNLNFANIPSTLQNIYWINWYTLPLAFIDEIPKNNHTVAIFLDCFGYALYKELKTEIKEIFKRHKIKSKKILSQFPSTTVAHVTTLNTWKPVYDHGLYEFYMFQSLLNNVICPFTGEIQENYQYQKKRIKLTDYLPKSNYFETFRKNNIEYRKYIPRENIWNEYDDFYNIDATIISYKNDYEWLHQIRESIEKTPNEKKIHQIYFPQIDSLSHKYWIDTSIVLDTTILLLKQIHLLLVSKTSKTTFLIFADHWQDIARKRFYLNEIPHIDDYVYKNEKGEMPIIGSGRDLFIKTNRPAELKAKILEYIGNMADVYLIEEFYTSWNLWNNFEKVKKFWDVLVLPFEGNLVFWNMSEQINAKKIGNHGGMSSAEIEIPFLFFEN